MPYIGAETRPKLDSIIDELADAIVAESVDSGNETSYAGLLNYSITQLSLKVNKKLFGTGLKYWQLALLTGVLENVKLEYYRRIGVPFEREKIRLNGDISEYEEFTDRLG